MQLTIQQFFKRFPDNLSCLDHILHLRNISKCPKCDKRTNFSRASAERAYVCQWCGYHLYPCVGTPFEDSRTSLQLWFYAIYLFSTTRSGVSAKELQRQLGVTYKCAWRMGHQIRKHMGEVDGIGPLGGEGKEIEIDEGFFGKVPVLGIAERKGKLIVKKLPNKTCETIRPLITENVKLGSIVHTDEAYAFSDLSSKGYIHKTGNRRRLKQYNTNTLESYWARLKLSVKGTHVWVSPQHLDKYAAEFAYRFNRRHCPEKMLNELLGTFLNS